MTTYSDSFSSTLDPVWTTVTSENALVTNAGRLRGTTQSGQGNHAYVSTISNRTDLFAQITLASQTGTVNRSLGVSVRTSSAAETYYDAALYESNITGLTTEIVKLNGGAFTRLASEFSTTWVATDILKIVALDVSATLNVYRNGSGTPLLTIGDSAIASGSVGAMVYFDGTAADIEGDDFIGGDVTEPATNIMGQICM